MRTIKLLATATSILSLLISSPSHHKNHTKHETRQQQVHRIIKWNRYHPHSRRYPPTRWNLTHPRHMRYHLHVSARRLRHIAEERANAPVPAQIGSILIKNRYTKIGASGVIGNSWQESGWKSDSEGGLWGFTSPPESVSDLQAFAAARHKTWVEVDVQTHFLLAHVSPTIRAEVNHAGSPENAARIFMEQWERPAVATENLPRREEGARIAYTMHFPK